MVDFKRIGKRAAGVLAIALIAVQFVPVDRTNPPVESEVPAGPEAREVLRRACYDCHSHETVWPWYSYVAPFSWMVADHVEEGREEMNFSTWGSYSAKRQRHKIEECWEEVEEDEMPPWEYLPAHPSARLSEEDRQILRAWSRSAAAAIPDDG